MSRASLPPALLSQSFRCCLKTFIEFATSRVVCSFSSECGLTSSDGIDVSYEMLGRSRFEDANGAPLRSSLNQALCVFVCLCVHVCAQESYVILLDRYIHANQSARVSNSVLTCRDNPSAQNPSIRIIASVDQLLITTVDTCPCQRCRILPSQRHRQRSLSALRLLPTPHSR